MDEAPWHPDDVTRRLCAGLAHDITNFLSGVIGYGDIFRDWLAEVDADPAMRERVDFLVASAERFEAQVGRLRLLAGRVDPAVDAGPVAALAEQLRATGDPLELDLPAALPGRLPIAPRLAAELVAALRSLAAEGVPPATCAVAVDGGVCSIALTLPGAAVATGHLARLAEPYYALRELGRGDGLGLPLAATVARAVGGALDFANGDDGSLRCRLELPLAGDGA